MLWLPRLASLWPASLETWFCIISCLRHNIYIYILIFNAAEYLAIIYLNDMYTSIVNCLKCTAKGGNLRNSKRFCAIINWPVPLQACHINASTMCACDLFQTIVNGQEKYDEDSYVSKTKFPLILITNETWIGHSYELANFMIRSVLLDVDVLTNDRQKHDDVIKWKHFPCYWPFLRGIHRSPMNSPHKGQWRGAVIFSLICARLNGWVNNREAGDLRHHRAHYDVTVMHHIHVRGKPYGFFDVMVLNNSICRAG